MNEKTTRQDGPAPRQMVPAVQSALRLLRHLAEGDPVVRPSQTAKHLGINRTTLGRILSTLEAEGMIEKRHYGGGYGLGLGVRALCASALFSADLLQVADPILIELTENLGLSSHLGVLDGRSVVYLLRRVPNLHLVSNIQIGSRLPVHAVNAGRIILAYMSREKVIAIFDGFELETVTDKTPTTLDQLLRQIDEDRQLGLAWSDSNFEIGISSVAAPIFDHAGQIIASINVTGTTQSFETNPQRRTEIGTAVSRAAHNISQRLGFSPPASKTSGRTDTPI